jgi:Ca2+-binding RTX toxin-like protein
MADFFGTKDADKIVGTTLQDKITGEGGDDVLRGDDDNDTIFGGSGQDEIYGGAGDDYINAGTGDDTIDAGDGNDAVWAGEGNDLVIANGGDDMYQGGKGFDTIDFSGSDTGMKIDLSKGTASGQGVDIVQGFEKVIGSIYGDNIKGSNTADVILAGEGENVLRGMGGADELTGGFDRDIFVWKTTDVIEGGAHRGVDTIYGWENNDGFDLRGMLEGIDKETTDLNEHVRFEKVDGGEMLQVKVNDAFVNVAFVSGADFTGADMNGYAADGIILA